MNEAPRDLRESDAALRLTASVRARLLDVRRADPVHPVLVVTVGRVPDSAFVNIVDVEVDLVPHLMRLLTLPMTARCDVDRIRAASDGCEVEVIRDRVGERDAWAQRRLELSDHGRKMPSHEGEPIFPSLQMAFGPDPAEGFGRCVAIVHWGPAGVY